MSSSGVIGAAVTASLSVIGVYYGRSAYNINNPNANFPPVAPKKVKKDQEQPQQYKFYPEETVSDKIIFIPKQVHSPLHVRSHVHEYKILYTVH